MAKKTVDRNAQARTSESEARAAREAEQAEHGRQITAAVGNRNQTQLDAREAIAARVDEQTDREFQDFDGENIVPPDPAEAALRAEREAEEERQRLEAEANERAARENQGGGTVEAEPKKFKLKVNGKDVEFTEAEVLERAQKVESADEYLRFAKEAVERGVARAPSQDEPASGGEDAIEDTLTSALQGDKEAIQKIAQRLRAPSGQDMLTAVDDRMSFRSAVDWFRGEYKDVVEDPMLYRLVVDEDGRIARSDPNLPYRERLKRAGDHVRGWKQGLTKVTTTTNPKLAAKASVQPVPSAGGRQQTRDDEDEEEPVESVIEKMARQRHQSGAIRKQ